MVLAVVLVMVQGATMPLEPQRETERQWTCSLIGALVEEAEAGFGERPPELFLVSDRFRPQGRTYTLSDFVASLSLERHREYWPVHPTEVAFFEAVGSLSLGQISDAYDYWQSEAEIDCRDEISVEQAAPGDANDRLDDLIEARRLRAYLPAFSPDHLPPMGRSTCGLTGEAVPRLRFIEITRPAFSEDGRIAFFATPYQRFIYQRGWRTPWRQVAVITTSIC
jgi:hypothetical protein